MQRANVDDDKVKVWTENVEEMDKVLRENDGEGANVKEKKGGEKKKKSDNSARNINKFSNIAEADLF
jgi:hypothetical protein